MSGQELALRGETLPTELNCREVPVDLLRKVDVEAEEADEITIDRDVAQNNIAQLHGTAVSSASTMPLRGYAAAVNDDLAAWLSSDDLSSMSADDIAVLRNALSRMPKPVASTSRVWEHVTRQTDAARSVGVISRYRSFDPWMIDVCDVVGINDALRENLLAAEDAEKILSQYVSEVAKRSSALKRILSHLKGLSEIITKFLVCESPTVAEAIVVCAAAEPLSAAAPYFPQSMDYGADLKDDDLACLDGLRRRMVGAAEAVRRVCEVDPLLYSHGVLSGVRRALSQGGADLDFAVKALGGLISGVESLQATARAFDEYFTATAAFHAAMGEMDIPREKEKELVARLLLRRHLEAAARKHKIEWSTISERLHPHRLIDVDEFISSLEELVNSGIGRRLAGMCRDHSLALSVVVEVARRACVDKAYLATLAEPLAEVHPQIPISKVKHALKSQREIVQSQQELAELGVLEKGEIEELEDHVQWLLAAYALPASDDAIMRLIGMRGLIGKQEFQEGPLVTLDEAELSLDGPES